jgi:hypothetical protein
VEEDISAEKSRQYWFIDLDWFTQNNRSFFALVRSYLCPACRERLKAESAEINAKEVLNTISDCCSKVPGFINGELPILESIFRLFLANRNQPLDLNGLSQQLSKCRGGNSYRTSPEILYRLLKSDQYYGLCQVEG